MSPISNDTSTVKYSQAKGSLRIALQIQMITKASQGQNEKHKSGFSVFHSCLVHKSMYFARREPRLLLTIWLLVLFNLQMKKNKCILIKLNKQTKTTTTKNSFVNILILLNGCRNDCKSLPWLLWALSNSLYELKARQSWVGLRDVFCTHILLCFRDLVSAHRGKSVQDKIEGELPPFIWFQQSEQSEKHSCMK